MFIQGWHSSWKPGHKAFLEKSRDNFKSQRIFVLLLVLREFTVVDLHMSIFVCSDAQGRK